MPISEISATLNVTQAEGRERLLRVCLRDLDGQPARIGLFASVRGQMRNVTTGDERLLTVSLHYDGDSLLYIVFPAVAAGRWQYEVWAAAEGGTEDRVLQGVFSSLATICAPDASSGARYDAVLVLGSQNDVLEARFVATTRAEEAAARAEELRDKVADDIAALEGAKEVIEKLHGEIADAVLIDADEHWVIGGVDTFKPSRGERGENGLDADAVKRVEIDSVDELPEHGDGRHIYYVSNGTPATGWVSGGDADWYAHQVTVQVASEEFSTEEGESIMLLVARINAGSELVTADFDGEKLHLTAKIGGAQGNQIGLTATSTYGELSQSGVFLSGGVDHTRFDVYLWGESATGEERWINVGSDPSNLKFATSSVAGVVLLSSTQDSVLGGGIHKDTNGKIRVDDATTVAKGAVRLTAAASAGTFEECIGNTPEPAGSGYGNGIGVLRATTIRHGVVKLTNNMDETGDVTPIASAVKSHVSVTADNKINDYVDEAGEGTGNALTALINAKIAAAVASVTPTPSGTVVAYAGSLAPDGWLLCDGSEVSRSTYADLFAAIGITYGSSSDATFKLPNLLGKFVRGATDENVVGSYQTGAIPNITGSFYTVDVVNHTVGAFANGNRSSLPFNISSGVGGFAQKTFDASRISGVYQNVTEVRPENIALNYIIKL